MLINIPDRQWEKLKELRAVFEIVWSEWGTLTDSVIDAKQRGSTDQELIDQGKAIQAVHEKMALAERNLAHAVSLTTMVEQPTSKQVIESIDRQFENAGQVLNVWRKTFVGGKQEDELTDRGGVDPSGNVAGSL